MEKRTVGSIDELISFDASTRTRSRSSSRRSALAEEEEAFGASTKGEASIPSGTGSGLRSTLYGHARPPCEEGYSSPLVTGPYAYTPTIWPMLAAPVLLLALAFYAWRHRSAPGTRPFVLLVLCIVPWAVGAALELAAVDPGTKVLWFRFESAWKLPVATAALWFALEYADLGRWLTRSHGGAPGGSRGRTVLPAPHRTGTRAAQHRVLDGGEVRGVLGPAGRVLSVWGLVLGLAGVAVFLWLFLRSPLHRWPAALCLSGHLASRAGYLVDGTAANPFAPMDATMLGGTFTAAMYAVALLHFRMFELVPVARWTLVEQMTDGVVVLDAGAARRRPQPGGRADPRHSRRQGPRPRRPRPPALAPRHERRTRGRGEPPRPRSASARGPPPGTTRSSSAPSGTTAVSGSGTSSS